MDVLLVCKCRCSFFVRSFLVWISRWTVGFLPLPLTLQHRCVCVCLTITSLLPPYSSFLSLLFSVRPFQRFVVHSCHSLQHANNKVLGSTSVGSFSSPLHFYRHTYILKTSIFKFLYHSFETTARCILQWTTDREVSYIC